MVVSPILEGEYGAVYVPAFSLLVGKVSKSSKHESRSNDMLAEKSNHKTKKKQINKHTHTLSDFLTLQSI